MDDFEEEYRIINNGLVVPEYHKFCKNNKLNFHFWSKLPKDQYNPEIGQKESLLHNEAMDLYNKSKNRYHYFNGNVVEFYFTEWGYFNFKNYSIPEFIQMVETKEKEIKFLSKRFNITLAIALASVAVILLATIGFVAYFDGFRILKSSLGSYLFSVLCVVLLIAVPTYMERIIRKFPKKQELKEKRKIEKSIISLRDKINAIKNNSFKTKFKV